MLVREIMVTSFHCAGPTDKVTEVAAAMKRHNIGAVPICENNRLVGIITDRDITIECVSSGIDPKQREVREFMTANPITVAPEMDLRQAADIMGQEQVRRLPVVEGGRLVGMISLGDLAFYLKDDAALAEMLRRISVPVRAATAGGGH